MYDKIKLTEKEKAQNRAEWFTLFLALAVIVVAGFFFSATAKIIVSIIK